jgi:hypothetical protein
LISECYTDQENWGEAIEILEKCETTESKIDGMVRVIKNISA